MELVALDEDGKRILDYLGQTMVDTQRPEETTGTIW